jgi:hypothetical protein
VNRIITCALVVYFLLAWGTANAQQARNGTYVGGVLSSNIEFTVSVAADGQVTGKVSADWVGGDGLRRQAAEEFRSPLNPDKSFNVAFANGNQYTNMVDCAGLLCGTYTSGRDGRSTAVRLIPKRN